MAIIPLDDNHMIINRRQFVYRSAQAALTIGSAGVWNAVAAGAEQPTPFTPSSEPALPIIDTHQHLGDIIRKLRPTPPKPDDLIGSHVMKDYLEAIRGLGIVKAVYMEIGMGGDDQLAEAEYLIEVCRRGDTPTVAAVIGGSPGADSFKSYITRFRGSPYIKGVRQYVSVTQTGQCVYQSKPFIRGIRLLGELGMSFDLLLSPIGLPSAARLVDDCPHTQFILDHCGVADPKWFCVSGKGERAEEVAHRRQQADQWSRDIAALAKRKNVVCKISGIITQMEKDRWTPDDLAPVINHCLAVFGPDRVMFASDWPVCTHVATLRQWLAVVQQVVQNRSLEQQRKVFYDNAVRVYGLVRSLSS